MFASLNNRLHNSRGVTAHSPVLPAVPYGATGLEVGTGSGSYSLSEVKLGVDFIDGFCQASNVSVLIPVEAALSLEYLMIPSRTGAWVQTSAETLQSRLRDLRLTTVRFKTGAKSTWEKGVFAEAIVGWVRLEAANPRWLALSSIEAIQVLTQPSLVNN